MGEGAKYFRSNEMHFVVFKDGTTMGLGYTIPVTYPGKDGREVTVKGMPACGWMFGARGESEKGNMDLALPVQTIVDRMADEGATEAGIFAVLSESRRYASRARTQARRLPEPYRSGYLRGVEEFAASVAATQRGIERGLGL